MSKFKYLFLALFLVSPNLYADVVSLTSNYVAGQSDVVSKLNSDRIGLTNGVNNIEGATSSTTVQSYGQIKADTISEENMADDINSRIRTDEGASCSDLVVSGLLPVTTTATLIGSISAGIAYPDGYRIEKTTATAKKFTASKDTYVYLQTNGTFHYDEQANGASDPGEIDNAAKLCKVVTDGTEITTVTDQRTTSCTSGPFNIIKDVVNEASLDDLLKNGSPITGDNDNGWIQGLHVEYLSHTQFNVTPGSAYLNGRYRSASLDLVVPASNDDPANGVSGLDSGSVGASKKYNVFSVGELDNNVSMSVTYSEASTLSGFTYYRLIGNIRTDATGLFLSKDVTTVHAINDDTIAKAWVNFNGTGTVVVNDSFNVSSISDNGTGAYSITWNDNFADTNYLWLLSADRDDGTNFGFAYKKIAKTVAVVSFELTGTDFLTATDYDEICLMAMGD